MAAVEDPDTVRLGQFWLPEQTAKVGGLLSCVPEGVHLTLSPALLNPLIDPARPGRPSHQPSTVFGSVFDLGSVSIWPVMSKRTQAAFRTGGLLNQEEVEGSWILVGEHFTEEAFHPTELRIDLSHLALWLDRGHTAVFPNKAEGRSPSVGPIFGDGLETDLPEGGSVTVRTGGARYVHRPPTTRLEVPTWIKFELGEGLSMEMWWQRFIAPTSDLLSLLYGEQCTVLRAEVSFDSGDTWRSVHGADIDPAASSTDASPLLDAYELGATSLASWTQVCQKFNPSVRILVSSLCGQLPLEVDLLMLCTAAEGLHRRAYPGSSRSRV